MGCANTGTIASLGRMELSLTQMTKNSRRKYEIKNKFLNCTKKCYPQGVNYNPRIGKWVIEDTR